MTIVAVIPAYNEEVAIGSVIARTMQHVDEVLVIDDGSDDSTSEVAELMGATVIRHGTNSGKGAALRTAFKWAQEKKVDIIVTLDADGQHNPDEIPQLLHYILWKEADIVNGARFLKGHHLKVPKYRRLGQEILNFATNINSNCNINDSQSGFRAFSSSTFSIFSFSTNGMGIESEMLADGTNAGMRIKEVPITCRYDVKGSTFNPLRHGLSVLASIINQFQRKHPLLYFGLPGFICIISGIFFGIWTLYGYKTGDGFWIGKALLAMTLVILGSLGMLSGLILNSLAIHFTNINTKDKV